MWNFGSGSYGTEEAKAKLKGEKYKPAKHTMADQK
jgi:hypothetical protein